MLDTNVIIWFRSGSPLLSKVARDTLLAGKDPIFVSVASGWEYEQKRRLRPHELTLTFIEVCAEIPHEPLDLAFDVHRFAATLPMIHRDPFDRMLIAQAIHHDLTLIASDEHIRQYPVRTLW